jgi:hypothetical protein
MTLNNLAPFTGIRTPADAARRSIKPPVLFGEIATVTTRLRPRNWANCSARAGPDQARQASRSARLFESAGEVSEVDLTPARDRHLGS